MSFIFIDHRHRPYLVHKGWLAYKHPGGEWVALREVTDEEIVKWESQALPASLAKHYDMPDSVRKEIEERDPFAKFEGGAA